MKGFIRYGAMGRLGSLSIVAATLLITACQLTPAEQAALETALSPEDGLTSEGPPILLPPVPPACFEEEFFQPEAVVSKSIDLLFIVDTSGSLAEERARVADGLSAFVASLPADVDYRVGVMLAHGSKSKWAGKLWAASGRPLVLDSTKLSLSEIKSELRYSMLYPASDYYSDGGEEGLWTLKRALQGDRLPASRDAGFFRENAALAVVFVADENDICAEYPASVKPVADPDRLEAPAKVRDCAGITVDSVYAAVEEHQGSRPFVLGGVLYNNAQTMARVGENELGYGYLELIRKASGITVDLAGSHYDEGLADIGSLVTVKLDLQHQFTLTRDGIDESSLEVRVDGVETDFLYDADQRIVSLDEAGKALSEINVRYCMMPETGGEGPGAGGGQGGGGGGNPQDPGCVGPWCGGGVIGY